MKRRLEGLRGLVETALRGEKAGRAVAFAPVAIITCAIIMLYMRRSYAKQYRLAEDKRRAEVFGVTDDLICL